MKFPLAQEISRHVRDKVCKFYSRREIVQATSTITSNEAKSNQTPAKAFPLITSNSIKAESFASCSGNDEVPESPSCLVAAQGLDLIESNFTDVLSPAASYQITTYNEHEESGFGMILEDVEGPEKDVLICFTCKWCQFR